MRYRVLPYKRGSKGARALADALGGLVLNTEGSRFVPRPDDVVINWGSSRPDDRFQVGNPNHFNHPDLIEKASNKLSFFKVMSEAAPDYVPTFWTRKEDIPDDAYPVVCRTVLNGHSGQGIVIADSPEDLVYAPLYVKYINKKQEYRVHIGKGAEGYDTIAVQRKARRNGVPDDEVNWKVRSHDNGFVYVRNGVTPPESVIAAAKKVVQDSGLDFGAVDVIYNDRSNKAYVLEINTAPGIEGTTVEDYAKYFMREEQE